MFSALAYCHAMILRWVRNSLYTLQLQLPDINVVCLLNDAYIKCTKQARIVSNTQMPIRTQRQTAQLVQWLLYVLDDRRTWIRFLAQARGYSLLHRVHPDSESTHRSIHSVPWAVAGGGVAVCEHPFRQGDRDRRGISTRLLYFANRGTFVLAESSLDSLHSHNPVKLKPSG